MSQAEPRTIIANEVDIVRAREALAFMGGSLDAKRPAAWSTFGYPTEVTFPMLQAAYDRGGAAHGAVHRLLDGCWQSLPRIKTMGSEDETPWEKAVAKLMKDINAWAKLRDLDRRNMVGRYAALIYRVGDGQPLSQPMTTAKRLADIVPVYEDQLKPTKWNDDTASEDFGKPTMFQYKMRPVAAGADSAGRPDQWIDVHPSRVQILAEGSVGDMFDGVPMLKAGFNALIDIEKVTGGSAESYLKNSARTIVFQYEPNATLTAIAGADGQPGKTVRQVHEDQTKALNRNIDSSIVLQGGEANTLQTQMSDPGPAFMVAANLFSASVQIPFTVLFGQQTGRLASDEDKADMVKRCKSRQANELTPMLEQFIARMQGIGVIEAGEFEIEWPDMAAPSDAEKVDLLVKLASASKTAFDGGITEPLFDANELRKVVDFEPRADDGMPTEDDIAAEEAAAAAALAGATGQPVQKPAPTAKA